MSGQYRVAVILPVFNRENTLDRALQSVADQTLPPEEVIAVDDGSQDESLAVLKRWVERLPNMTVLSQDNCGVAAARNLAIRSATSPWIAFLDSDDEWTANKLSRCASVALATGADFVHSDRRGINGATRAETEPNRKKEEFEDKGELLSQWQIKTSTVFMRRTLFDDCKGFIENLYSCSDYEFFWRAVAISNRVTYIPESLVNIHPGPRGMARALPEHVRIQDNIRAMASAIEWLETQADLSEDHARTLRTWRDREYRSLLSTLKRDTRYAQLCREFWIYGMERLSGNFQVRPSGRDAL